MVSGFRGSSQNTWPLSLLPLPSSFLITTWSNRQSCFRRSMGTSSGHWNWDGGKDQRQLSYGTFITYRINREKWETCHFLARGGVVFALSCCTGPRRYCQNKINSQLLSKFTIPVTTDCYFPCFRCHSYLLRLLIDTLVVVVLVDLMMMHHGWAACLLPAFGDANLLR